MTLSDFVIFLKYIWAQQYVIILLHVHESCCLEDDYRHEINIHVPDYFEVTVLVESKQCFNTIIHLGGG